MGDVEEANFLFDMLEEATPNASPSPGGLQQETTWRLFPYSNSTYTPPQAVPFQVINGTTYFDNADIIFYTYYYGLLFTLSIINLIGNGLIVYCVMRHRRLRIPANYFLVSLACSDLVLGVVYPIYNVSHMEAAEIEKSIGVWGSCTVIITLTLGMLNVSSYNLVGVTVTRYISIKDPLKFVNRVTHTRAVTAVVLVWSLLMILACGLYLRPYKAPENYTECRYEIVLYTEPLHIFFTCIFSMIIPLCIMIVLYTCMTIIARRQARAIFSQDGRRTSAQELRGRIFRQELKMFRVAGTLLGYFTLAWAPFVIFEFVSIVNKNHNINRYIRATVRLILHSNSAVNAFIYAGRVQEFRDAMKKETSCIHCCKRKCRHPEDSIDLKTVRATHNGSSTISRGLVRTDRELSKAEDSRGKQSTGSLGKTCCSDSKGVVRFNNRVTAECTTDGAIHTVTQSVPISPHPAK